jgi:Flp pilus assembly pilin Flp
MYSDTGAPIVDSSARVLLPTETSQAKPWKNYSEQSMNLDEYLSLALTRFLREEEGASFTEYALVVSLITAVCVLALLALGKDTWGLFQFLASAMG